MPKKIQIPLGFTLLELIVTLALGGALIFLTISSVAYAAKRNYVSSSATKLRLILERSHTRAIQFHAKVRISLHRESYRVTHLVPENPKRPRRLRDLSVLLPSSITIDLRNPPSTLFFYPTGVATPATITLTNGSRSCTLVLSLRGRITQECNG